MKKLLLILVRGYQLGISPFVRRFAVCRYEPSCSQYAYEAIKKHGAWHGGALAIRRLLSCHPFGKRPPFDPVP